MLLRNEEFCLHCIITEKKNHAQQTTYDDNVGFF